MRDMQTHLEKLRADAATSQFFAAQKTKGR
jgi:hypothetical protein